MARKKEVLRRAMLGSANQLYQAKVPYILEKENYSQGSNASRKYEKVSSSRISKLHAKP